jgi:hypothetical protein
VTEEPLWINMFHEYEDYPEREIESRPAWFHLANHAFSNAPIFRLPAFLCAFEKGKIYSLRFLDDDLSDHVRSFIGKELLDSWIELKNQVDLFNSSIERNSMI